MLKGGALYTGLASGVGVQPRSRVGIDAGGLVCSLPLASSHTPKQRSAEKGATDVYVNTAIWQSVKPAAVVDMTLRRLLDWLEHTLSDGSRYADVGCASIH